jgi:[ribosomal protein S5]-alanine N-acetyltransferase
VTSTDAEHRIELVRLHVPALEALVGGDLAGASSHAGVDLTPYFLDEVWLWRLRLDQLAADPGSGDWIARAAVDATSGAVVGHVGFHGPPNEDGMVEVGYSVDPQHRRRGYGRALLRTALAWATSVPDVRTVRASIGPENAASLATLRPFGFRHIGEQWDEKDGRELLYELSVADR